ncbi:MAG: V-type ATP synthase subunit F [Candidatus Lokiarchaeota archaeon]
MVDNKIHIIGYEEIVHVLGLIGIKGTILEDPNQFKEKFEKVKSDPSISMIIIALELPEELISSIMEFKLNTKSPFVFYMPKIFQRNLNERSPFLEKFYESIKRIIP